MSVNFLLQATRIIHVGNYDDSELTMMYEYLRNLDNMTLNTYLSSNSVVQYKNDLELCIEVIDKVIKILEDKEEYEKCQQLLIKKEEAMSIISINTEEYERI